MNVSTLIGKRKVWILLHVMLFLKAFQMQFYTVNTTIPSPILMITGYSLKKDNPFFETGIIKLRQETTKFLASWRNVVLFCLYDKSSQKAHDL